VRAHCDLPLAAIIVQRLSDTNAFVDTIASVDTNFVLIRAPSLPDRLYRYTRLCRMNAFVDTIVL
jgi:hypothetical protein